MSQEDLSLKAISNETKSSIDEMQIVTPSIYASIFAKFAEEHNVHIEHEEELSHTLLATECSTLTDMQKTTTENAIKLSDNTQKAIDAIQEKDEAALTKVLTETNQLKREIEKLKKSLYTDELTAVSNRKWLYHALIAEDQESFKHDGLLAMIDLNYFKQINDTHGHIIGDKVLIFIASELKKTRQHVVRYGGDEFMLFFSDRFGLDNAVQTLSALREKVISKKLKASNGTFRSSFSFGVVEYKAGEKFADVTQRADEKMYEDKIEIKKRIKGI